MLHYKYLTKSLSQSCPGQRNNTPWAPHHPLCASLVNFIFTYRECKSNYMSVFISSSIVWRKFSVQYIRRNFLRLSAYVENDLYFRIAQTFPTRYTKLIQ